MPELGPGAALSGGLGIVGGIFGAISQSRQNRQVGRAAEAAYYSTAATQDAAAASQREAVGSRYTLIRGATRATAAARGAYGRSTTILNQSQFTSAVKELISIRLQRYLDDQSARSRYRTVGGSTLGAAVNAGSQLASAGLQFSGALGLNIVEPQPEEAL